MRRYRYYEVEEVSDREILHVVEGLLDGIHDKLRYEVFPVSEGWRIRLNYKNQEAAIWFDTKSQKGYISAMSNVSDKKWKDDAPDMTFYSVLNYIKFTANDFIKAVDTVEDANDPSKWHDWISPIAAKQFAAFNRKYLVDVKDVTTALDRRRGELVYGGTIDYGSKGIRTIAFTFRGPECLYSDLKDLKCYTSMPWKNYSCFVTFDGKRTLQDPSPMTTFGEIGGWLDAVTPSKPRSARTPRTESQRYRY